MHRAEAAVARLTGGTATGARRIAADVFEVDLDGRPVVAKRSAGTNATAAEAASLNWLGEADAVPLPEVRGHDEEWLVMARVAPGEPTPAGAEAFGRALAAMHAAGADAFGCPPPGGPVDAWIGRTWMRNLTGEHWPRWYAEQRVLPYLRAAVDAGTLDAGGAHVVEQAAERVPELAGPDEPPARLHGDLWNGNVLWAADGRVWLIDPASHGGHRETDLAMLHLFGCQHLDRILGGYQAVAPLADGWQRRIALHQLYPLLVHVVLFGGGYVGQALTAARTALRG